MRKLRLHKEECDDVPGASLDRSLCEIKHYNTEYHSEASQADIAYEIGKTARTEPCIVGAINRGMKIAHRNLPKLINRGLVAKSKLGGLYLTSKGKKMMRGVERKYGIRFHR